MTKSSLPPLNRVYRVQIEITYDFGRLKRFENTVVAAPNEEAAFAKAKARFNIFGEITNYRVDEQPGARW